MKKYFILLISLIFLFTLNLSAQVETIPGTTEDTGSAETVDQPPSEEPLEEPEEAEPGPFKFGLQIASEIIGDETYTHIGLKPDLAIGKFGIGLDVIFRFDKNFKLYKPDWDSWEDAAAKINYIRWDKKGAPLFIKIGLLDDVYLGHGTILYRYSNKLFLPEKRRIGIQFDLDLKSFGWELFDDDIIYNRIIGSRIYFRPFVNSPIFFLNKLAVGVTCAADIKLDSKYNNTREVALVGGDIDIPLFNVPDIFQFILFTDYVKNTYFKGSDGSGLIPGFILEIIGFRFIGDYHFYQPNYDGPYFNAFYDLERDIKLAELDKKTEETEGWTIKMMRDILGLLHIGFEVGEDQGERTDMHIELSMMKKLLNKFKASVYYDKKDIKSFEDAFSAQCVNAKLTANIFYSVSETVDLMVLYQRSYTEGPFGPEPVENISFGTKINL